MAESCNRTNFTPILAKNTPGEDINYGSGMVYTTFSLIKRNRHDEQTNGLSNYF